MTGVLAVTSAMPLVPSHRSSRPGTGWRPRCPGSPRGRAGGRAGAGARPGRRCVAVGRIGDGLAGASTETGPAATGRDRGGGRHADRGHERSRPTPRRARRERGGTVPERRIGGGLTGSAHDGRTIAQPPQVPSGTMIPDRSAAALLRAVGLLADGPVPWGRPVPPVGAGVFVVELADAAARPRPSS